MDDESNIALRKFLKQVGVTSQQAIEEALRAAGDHAAGQEFVATMTLTVKGLDLEHQVTGTVKGPAK